MRSTSAVVDRLGGAELPARPRASRRVDAAAITLAPIAAPSSTADSPTPPAAPSTSSVSPGCRSARSLSAWYEVPYVVRNAGGRSRGRRRRGCGTRAPRRWRPSRRTRRCPCPQRPGRRPQSVTSAPTDADDARDLAARRERQRRLELVQVLRPSARRGSSRRTRGRRRRAGSLAAPGPGPPRRRGSPAVRTSATSRRASTQSTAPPGRGANRTDAPARAGSAVDAAGSARRWVVGARTGVGWCAPRVATGPGAAPCRTGRGSCQFGFSVKDPATNGRPIRREPDARRVAQSAEPGRAWPALSSGRNRPGRRAPCRSPLRRFSEESARATTGAVATRCPPEPTPFRAQRSSPPRPRTASRRRTVVLRERSGRRIATDPSRRCRSPRVSRPGRPRPTGGPACPSGSCPARRGR